MSLKAYQLPKDGDPKVWNDRQRRKPRHYWLHLVLKDESDVRVRKFCSWDAAISSGDWLFSSNPESWVLWLIDGRVDEADLLAPPNAAIWCRWEHEQFVEDGKPAVPVVIC